RTRRGRVCRSDHRISFQRVPQPEFPDGRRRRGWLVRVRRPRRRAERRLARTLAEATAWARRHWEPEVLCEVRAALPEGLRRLYRQAIDGGGLLTFRALLDAAQEAGATVRRPGSLIATARTELLLPKDLPITDAERAEARADAQADAGWVIAGEARDAHENNFSSRRGTNLYPRERL